MEVNSPVDEDLWSVSFGDTVGLAVGTYGTVVKYSGSAWTQIGSPTEWGLYDVDMAADDSGWAVGANRLTLRWDGNAFSPASGFDPVPGLTINTVFCINEDEAWAGGAVGKIYHYVGGGWNESELDDPEHSVFGLYFQNPYGGWAASIYNAIYRYENGNWSNVGPTGDGNWNYKGIVFNSSGVGWAVGTDGVIIKYSPAAVEPTSLGHLKALFY